MSATGRSPRGGDGLDAFPTPDWCVDRLLEAIQPFSKGGTWLEPCAGDGAIVRAVNRFRQRRAWVGVRWDVNELRRECASDLRAAVNRVRLPPGPPPTVRIGDFLNFPIPKKRYDVAITNPPFSIAQDVIERALKCADQVFMLLRLNYAASEKRAAFMREHTPSLYVLPNRPSFRADGKTDATEYAWFRWNRLLTSRIYILDSTDKEERLGNRETSTKLTLERRWTVAAHERRR